MDENKKNKIIMIFATIALIFSLTVIGFYIYDSVTSEEKNNEENKEELNEKPNNEQNNTINNNNNTNSINIERTLSLEVLDFLDNLYYIIGDVSDIGNFQELPIKDILNEEIKVDYINRYKSSIYSTNEIKFKHISCDKDIATSTNSLYSVVNKKEFNQAYKELWGVDYNFDEYIWYYNIKEIEENENDHYFSNDFKNGIKNKKIVCDKIEYKMEDYYLFETYYAPYENPNIHHTHGIENLNNNKYKAGVSISGDNNTLEGSLYFKYENNILTVERLAIDSKYN